MNIDHICIAVRSIQPAAEKFSRLFGYHVRTDVVTNTRQRVNVQFLAKPGSLDIKLIEPHGEDSPLWPFVKKGGGLHHVCFKTDDTVAACDELADKGLRVVTPPEPGEAFDEALIAFCYAGFGLNVEIIDTDRRRALREDCASE
ncbi:MAG: VOC family protein [Chromatocurvus sp.]